MNDRRWVWGFLIAGALGVWACSSDPTGNSDGDGGAPTTHAGGESGGGGEGASKPGGCRVEDDCESYGDCSTLEDLEAECDVVGLMTYPSTCGGTVVEQRGVVQETLWIFDPDGNLIGGSDEAEGTCASWGESCGALGQGEPLCDPEPACIEHETCDEWGANFACPEQLADVTTICDLGGIDMTRSASDCGGTFVYASNGIQTVRYTFDADGQLIGVSSIGDVGDCDFWGTSCQPIGAAEVLCGDGGAGGAGGEGGEGGANGP